MDYNDGVVNAFTSYKLVDIISHVVSVDIVTALNNLMSENIDMRIYIDTLEAVIATTIDTYLYDNKIKLIKESEKRVDD